MFSKQGKAYLFNISKDRKGSQHDVENLKKTFKNLNIEVEEHSNLTASQIETEMGKIEKKDFSKYDFVVIMIGTHGHVDGLARTNSSNINWLSTFLGPLFRNKSLHGKLKWIISQMCRGTEEFDANDVQNSDARYYLISYAATEGFVSNRQEDGTIFIKSLCEELQALKSTQESKDILKVMERVEHKVKVLTTQEEEIKGMQQTKNEHNFGKEFSFSFSDIHY